MAREVVPVPLPKLAGPWNEIAQFRQYHKHKAPDMLEHVCMACQHGEHVACFGHGDGRAYQRADGPEGSRIQYPVCLCASQGHPVGDSCAVKQRGDSAWSAFHRCNKPAKGTVESSTWTKAADGTGESRWGHPREVVQIPACGVHVGAEKRSKANEERRREDSRLQSEGWARDRQAEQAAIEKVPEVIAALQELGVARADLQVATNHKGRITLTVDAAEAILKALDFLRSME